MFRVVVRAMAGAIVTAGVAFPAHVHASSAEESMLAEINDARRANGVPALRESPLLSESASSYSRYMLARNYFGHLSAVRASGKFTLKGEILAWHSGSNARVGPTLAQLAELTVAPQGGPASGDALRGRRNGTRPAGRGGSDGLDHPLRTALTVSPRGGRRS